MFRKKQESLSRSSFSSLVADNVEINGDPPFGGTAGGRQIQAISATEGSRGLLVLE